MKSLGVKNILFGALILAAGGVITWYSYSGAEPGDSSIPYLGSHHRWGYPIANWTIPIH